MASSPSLVKRTAFVEKYLKMPGTDNDIYSAILNKTSINTGGASGRDFMALFGEYCIEGTDKILTAGDYLFHPQSPKSLKKVVMNLLEDCKTRKIAGTINFFVPLCVKSEPGKPGHWNLVTLVIENGLIKSVELADSGGQKPEIRYNNNLNTTNRDSLEGFCYWFKDYAPSMFAPDCIARQVLYAEQGIDDHFSCLDRMIINLLRKRARGIIGETDYNLCYGAYSGLDGANRLRAITAQLLKNSIAQNSECRLKDISSTSLKSFIDSSLRANSLPITGELNFESKVSLTPRVSVTILPGSRGVIRSPDPRLAPSTMKAGQYLPLYNGAVRRTHGLSRPRPEPETSTCWQSPPFLVVRR